MTNRTLTVSDMREILRGLDQIKELTNLLRRDHFGVPYKEVYDAAGAEGDIRDKILRVALVNVEVETAPVVKVVPSRPATQSEAA